MYHVSAQGVDERMINVHYYYCVVTSSLTGYETLKWLSSLPILMQESLWW